MSSSSRKNSQQSKNKTESATNSSPKWRAGLLRGSVAEPLEPRIMLDAAGVDAANDALGKDIDSEPRPLDNSAAQSAENRAASSSDLESADIIEILAGLPSDGINDAHDAVLDSVPAEQKQELVLVDTTVENYQQLLADLLEQSGTQLPDVIEPGTVLFTTSNSERMVSVMALDTNLSGINAITDALGNHENLDAVHVLSHGDQGALKIGNDTINQQSLTENTHDVAQWQTAFNAGGDFLLYGCYTGEDAAGVAFVNALALTTGTDVAASTDPTGHASAGGDWQLEVAVGNIDTQLVTGSLAQALFHDVLAAAPTAVVDTPAGSFINEPFEFCVLFENTGTDAGYEPYLDVYMEPGVVVNGASYLGAPLDTANTFTWNGSAWIDGGGSPITEHPLSSAIPLPGSPGATGTTWIMLDLPFGSFVPGQPPAKVTFDAELDPASGAVVGDGIDITAQAGFELGEDPFDNPDSDAPILGPATSGTTTPTVWEIEKLAISGGDNAVGIEEEQGTGPNNPITYEIRVDIADGQTVDNIVLSDLVPNNIHYLGSLTVSGSGAQVNLATSDATIGVHNGNQLSVSFDSVTGTLGDDDIIINFDGYIPDLDANGVPILGPANGLPSDDVINEVVGDGEYGGQNITDDAEHIIAPKSVAIQKSNTIFDSAGNPVTRDTVIPGDFIEWTLLVQVSDYMSLDEFIIDDQFGDGQLYVPGSATLEYTNNGVYTAPSAIAAGDITLNAIDPSTGLTIVTFDVANAIGGNGQLDGDLATDIIQTSKTGLTVKFRTEIQENFQYPSIYGGNASVDVGDNLSNDVDISAEVVGTDNSVVDGSSSSVSVSVPVASKSIYAIHEDTDDWDPADPEIAPGQSITYRITIELPTTDVENLIVTDYMPLPVFAVHPAYDYTGFYSGVDNVPAPGQFGFGPLTNVADFPPGFFNTTGTTLDIANVTTDPVTNTIVWDFDSFSQVGSTGGVIDLLFTTETANIPFEDGLTLTNQTQVSYDNTNYPQDPIASIVQLEPLAPELALTKGVVAVDPASVSAGTFDAPVVGPVVFNDAGTAGAAFAGSVTSSGIAASPIDSDLSGVDAGDTVRFAITVENAGGFQATDITVSDDFPAGFVVPPGGLNLQAALGDGTALGVVGSLFDASGNPDATGISFQSGASDLNLGAGRIDSTIVDDGSNIIVVTYDLLLDTTVAAASVLTNTAEILTFSAVGGFVDYTDGNTNEDWADDATVESVGPANTKELVSTGIDNADNPLIQAVPGEYINYRVTIDLPEGSLPAAEIRDRLDSDLRFDSLLSITPSSADVTTDIAGGFAGVIAPAFGSAGVLNFDFGTITNANTDNTVPETLTLEYRVYVAGTTGDGKDLNNRADFRWDNDGDGNNPGDGLVRARAPDVEVITPKLNVVKTIEGTPPTDVGDPISYKIRITHRAASDTDAFNVSFSDVIPSEISNVSIDSVTDGGTGAGAGFTLSGNTISNPDFDFALGDKIVLFVSGTVANALTGQAIINTADIDWTTLDDTDPDDGVDAEEPTYTASDPAEFTVAPPELTKSIISTGIDTTNNSNTEVVQGEYVVYRVLIEVPEGTTSVAEVIDTLPANMTYDTGYTPTVTLNNANLAIGNPGVPPTINGQDISFNFGTIVNSGNDNAVVETISIDYRVFVNDGVNGDMLTNSAQLRWDVDGDGTNDGVTDGSKVDTTTVDVLVPVLEVDKQVTTPPTDAGDAVQYTITISHNALSNTDAYDATFSDVIPSEISGVSVVSAIDGAGNPVAGFTALGNTVTNTDFDLELTNTITLVVSGIVNSTASASSTVSNTAEIDWDTLGDDAEGAQASEATGDAENSAVFVVASPTFDKSILNTGINDSSNNDTQVVAGEFVTYQLVVTVPEGTTPMAEITDVLDADLIFDPTFAITAVGSSGVTLNGPATTPVVAGTNVTFDLGTIVNTDVDDSVDDTVTITYRVYADADVVLGDTLPNDATFIWDGDNDGDNTDPEDGSLDDGTTVTVISPELEIEKSITTVPSDSGDTIVYDVLIKHTAASNAGAMDVVFTDALPSEIDAVSVTAVDSNGAAVTGFVIVPGATQDTISNPDFNLALNDTVRLTITGTVNSTVSASSTVLNTATISWDTLDDDAATDGFDNNPDPADNIEVGGSDSDEADFVVASPTFDKSVLSTGINDTSNNDTQVVAGEFVTYQLVVTVPEGTTPMAEITDVLDADLIFDPTFAITAVGSSGVTFNGPATTPLVAGTNVTFDLGTIVNTDVDDAVDDTVTITYRVYADADVVLGDVLPNDAALIWDGDNDGDNTDPEDGSLDDGTSVTVIAPELEIEKSIATVPSDGGDTIVYDVLIQHTAASNAGAMDVVFTDVLPSEIDAVSVTAVDSNGATVTGFVIVPGATQDTISNPDFNLALNDTVRLTITGTVNATASASSTVLNTATISWDTLDDNAATDGFDNNPDPADNVEVGGSDADDADFVIASPSFAKSVLSTGIDDSSNNDTQVVAGEFVTYQLVVTVPEGTTPMAQITDVLDSDLIFDPTFAITAVGSSGVTFSGPATTPVVAGTNVTFDLGTIVNTDVDDIVDDTVTITYRVYADADVVLGDVLPNDATFIWDGDNDGDNTDPEDGSLDDGTSVTVIAPELEIEKSIATVPSDGGDTIVYDVLIQHTAASNAGAMDVVFTDVLPSEIDAVSVTAVDSNGATVTGFVIVPGATQDTISNPDFNLALNDTVRLTITGTVNATASASSTVLNTATISWDTLDDNAATDGFDNNPDPADNVEVGGSDADDADFVIASPSFAKSVLSTGIDDSSNNDTQVVAGEFVTYQLVVTVPEGTTPMAQITDVLDANLIFDPTFAITAVGSSGVTFNGPATAPVVAGTNVSFDLGTIVNTDVDDTVADTVTITYRVYADADVVLGDVLPNDATFIWDGDNDGDNTDPEDGSLDDGTAVTVISPELEIEKSITTVPSDSGDTIVYDVLIKHTATSNAGAMDVVFTDALPSEIDAVSVTAVDGVGANVTGFVIVPGATQDTISNPDFNLALNDTVQLTITGTVNSTASASSTVLNTATISWDTLDDDAATDGFDNNPDPADNVEVGGSDSDDADFVVASPNFDKSILSTGINDSTNNDTQVVAGEFVTYQLVVTVPEGTTPMAEITDVLDADLIFDPTFAITAVGSNGVTFNGPATNPLVAGTNVTFDLGTIVNTDVDDAVADTVTITYRVYADADVVLGDMLPNDATFIWDGDNDGDNTDPEDGSLDDGTTVTVIGPELVVEKSVTQIPSDVGDPITYQIVIRHSVPADAPVSLSQTTAYDVTLSDNLPAGLTGLTIDSAVDSSSSPITGFDVTGNTLSHAGFDLALGETITLTISGIVGPDAVEGDTITNVADINWTSLDDDSDDGNDSVETSESASDDADFTIGNITKSVFSTGINDASNDNTEAVTGEFVTYQLVVEIPQGASPVAEIEDVLDAGLIFDTANGVSVTPSSANVSTSLAPGDFSNTPVIYDSVANTISIDLGDINNTAPVGSVEHLTLLYRVYVADDTVNAPEGASLNNTAEFKWDIDGDGSNDGPDDGSTEGSAPEITVTESELELIKSITTVPQDAGDTIVYDVLIQHTAGSTAGAMDIVFTDTLPSEIDAVSVTAVDSAGATVTGFVVVPGVTQDTISNPDFNLALNNTVRLTITGTVNTTAHASTTVLNTAEISWDSLDDDNVDDGFDNNPDPANNVEVGGSDADDADFLIASPSFAKSVLSTGINDASNDNSQVVAGEFVTYQLVVTVPEGTTPLAEITDVLDADLVFDPTFAITATGSSGVSFNGPATTPLVVGSNVSFDLGTIVNTDVDDTVADTLTITYRVYADADVVLGDVLPNDATFIWDGDNDGDNTDPEDGSLDDGTTVTTISPELEIEKSITTVPSDGGDTIVYDVLIKHTAASTAGAMDIVFTDVLPSEIDAVSVTAVNSTGTSVSGFVIVPGATQDTISNPDFNLALNDSIRLTITGTVNATVSASSTVLNTATISWDTLDDDAATDGFDNNPDPADNVEVGGSDSDDADFIVASPKFDKLVLSTGINDTSNDNSQVVAGEFVTYQLVVTVPEGTTPMAEITDVLDSDLIFDPTFAITAVGSSGVSISGPATTPTVAGTNVTFDLGTIVNTDVDDAVDDTVTITYRVYADADVVLGDVLPNDATFIWDADNDGDNTDSEDGSLDDGTTVTVISPELEIEKSITTVPFDGGDTIVYDVLIKHTAASTAGAMDVVFTDVLPSEIDAVSVTAVDSAGVTVPGFVIVSGATQDAISNPDFNLALNDTVRLTITGIVNSTASASTTVLNTATISWDTLDDDASDDGFDNNPDPADNVEVGGSDSDDADFVVASPTFDKSVLSTGINDTSNNDTQVVAGEFVTYQLVVTVPEGTTPMAEITDVLDVNLIFDPTFAITAVGSSGVTISGPATTPVVAGSNVTFDLGTIVNTDIDDSADDTVTITYRVYADADVVLGDVLPNDATFIWDGDNDGDNTDPEDGSLDDSTTVTVISPELEIEKSITAVPSDGGDTIVYDVLIKHAAASTAGAMDVVFTDILPSEIDAVSVTAVDSVGANVTGFVIVPGATQDTISNPDFNLALNDTVRLTITGIVNSTASASTTVLNTATISWDTLDDDAADDGFDNNLDPADNIEVGGSDVDDADFLIASPSFAKSVLSTGINDSSNNDAQVVAGEFVTYQLVVTVPEGTTPLAEITDVLDADLIFDPTFAITAVGSSGVTFNGPATTPLVVGSNVSFDLGTIVNTDVDDIVADTVKITYRVYADADVVLADVLPNDATFIWDGDNDGDNTDPEDGSLDDGTTVTVISPELEIEKSITTVPSDGGDTIVYDVLIQHTAASTAGAMDVVFTDALPSEIDAVSVTAEDSNGATVNGFVIVPGATQDTISNPDFNLGLNDTVRLTITGIVNSTASASSTVLNTATISWDTLDDDASDDGFDNSPDPADNVEVGGSDTDDVDFVMASPSFAKSVLSTGINDSSNNNSQVVAGEFVTYQLIVTVPEGTTPLAEISDVLDADLIFDPTFAITAVGSSGVTFNGPATTPLVVGSNVSFDLGTIVNTDVDDSVADTVTITYRVYADADVVLGDVLPNDATFIWDGDNDGDNTDPEDGSLDDGTTVTTISPELEIEKSITTVPSDGGDTIVYDVLIQHTAASTAGAMDVVFTDALPSEIDAVSVTAEDSNGATVNGFVIVPGATQDTISNPDFNLGLNDTVRLTITGIVNSTASASSTVLNTATISWDTLDDDAADDGFDNNPDPADNVEVGGSDADEADFVVASPSFDKLVLSTGINDSSNNDAQVVAGEFVTYQLVVTVPEGTTPLAEITDVLDANLIFDPTFAITAVGSSGVTLNGPATTPLVAGNNVTFDLGTIVNTDVDDGVADTVTITYRVYADADVVLGDVLPNDATFIWDADNDGDNTDIEDGSLDDGTTVSVIGTELVVEKSVTQIPSDVGDPITYQIVIRHSVAADAPVSLSQTTAYDVTLSDNLPAGLTGLTIDSAVDSSSNPITGFDVTGNTLSHAGFDLALGETINLTISGIVGPTVVEGDTITNVADINWTSLDDDSDDGNDSVETSESASDDADFTIGGITKSVLSTGINDASNDNTEAVTGEYITYQLAVEIPQGTALVSEIEDTLDAGLVFDPSYPITVTPSSANLTTSALPGDFSGITATYDSVTNRISIPLGDVTNSAPVGTVETLTLTYRVYVANDSVNAPVGASLNNTVDYKWDIDGDGSNDGPADGITEATAPVIEVVAPELKVNKALIVTPVDAGDTVTYEITIEHTANSKAAAFDASFSDLMPSEISGVNLVSVIDSNANPVGGFSVSGNTVSNPDFDLALGDSIVITVTGTVNTTASASTTVSNTANIDWDTLGDDSQGNQSVEDGGNDQSSEDFVVASPEFDKLIVSTGINDASNDNTGVVAGEFIVYSLVVTVPEGTTPMVEITDTLNADLIFDPSYPINVTPSSGVSFSGSPTVPTVSGNTVHFDLGTVVNTDNDDGVADTVTVTYRVYTDVDVALGDVLDNSATLIWDTDNDGDNTEIDDGSLSDQTNVTTLVPAILIEKSVTQVPADVGDTIEYTFVIRHTDLNDTPLSVSNAAAYDIEFGDNLPNGVVNAAVLSAVDSSGGNVAGFTTTNTAASSRVDNASFDLAVGETVTLTVIAELSNAILEGDTIVNTASVNWSSLDADSDDGNDAGEATNSDSDSADFSIANVEKSVVGTGINDALNDNTEAVTGEFVHYRVVVEVPQGNSPQAELVDVLDAGLIFDLANGVSVMPSSANLTTTVLPGDFSQLPASYDQSTNTISIPLGDIVNSAPAGVVETLTLNYRVYVANDSVAAATGATLNNSVDFRWDVDGDGNNNGPLDGTTEDAASPITVITPELEVIKDIVNMPSETGDLITYRFTVQHTGNSQTTAYDVSFIDALPTGISGIVIDSVSSTGAPVSGFNVVGNTVSNTSFDLAFGESVTVLVSGSIDASVDAGDTIPNTANITWSSLDAENGSDGADAFDPSADGFGNDSDSESFSIADIHKRIIDTGIDNGANSDAEVVNGEYITYQVVIDIPQGSTPVAQITDRLDAGLAFDSLISVLPTTSELSTSVGAGDFSDIVAPAQGSTGTIKFTLGDIVNTNDNNATTESVILTYQVYATNANVVSAGAQLNNSVQLAYDTNGDGRNNGPGDGRTGAAAPNVTVLEPQLSVGKTVDDTAPHLGQTITYTVVVTNESVSHGTDAMDVNVSDNLPAGMSFHPGSITVNGNSIIGLSGAANNSVGNNLNLTLDKVKFASSTVITYQATVSSDIADFSTSLANTVNIDWSTLSAKDYDDGIDNEERGASDGYSSSANEVVTLTAPDYAVSKSSSNNGPLRAGDAFSYTVNVTNVGTHEGTGVVVTDQFPVIALGSPAAISGGGVFDESTGVITWNIAGLSVNESVAFTVDVSVLETLSPDLDGDGNSLSDTFTNSVSVTDDGLNGQDPNPENNNAADSDEIIATPDYGISKTNDIEMAAPLSQFTYVIEADNHGTQAGTGVVIVDKYPQDILSVVDADGGTVDTVAGTITWQYPVMNVGDSVLLNVLMEVLPTANLDTPDQLFHNNVAITDDGNNGPDDTPEDNSDSHSDMLLAGAGEPMSLIAPPETITGSSQWLGVQPGDQDDIFYEDVSPSVNEPRFVTSQAMLAENQSSGLFTDDVLRGGGLLDTFKLDKLEPSEECAVHYTRADVSPEELLSEDVPSEDSNPWGWLDDLPETNPSGNQSNDANTTGHNALPAALIPDSHTAMLADNTIQLPMTSLDGAISLFNRVDSAVQMALAELPDNQLTDLGAKQSNQVDAEHGE